MNIKFLTDCSIPSDFFYKIGYWTLMDFLKQTIQKDTMGSFHLSLIINKEVSLCFGGTLATLVSFTNRILKSFQQICLTMVLCQPLSRL